MKNGNRVFWGIVLVAVGMILALNAFGFTSVNLFFDGWWTLFIIVPCLAGLISREDKMGNLVGLAIGVFLLLCCRDILNFDILWKLAFPCIIILFGLKMLFGSLFDRSGAEAVKRLNEGGAGSAAAVFSGETLNYSGQEFHGAELNAVFGGLKCDLRNAVIDRDCAIRASAVFGGIDILVPAGVNVKVSSNSIFGGVSNKADSFRSENAVTLYIKADCMFGGVEIK